MTSPASWKSYLGSSGFAGDLVVSSDPEYADAIARFATNAQRRAGLVAFVRSPQDVSLVIKYTTAVGIPIVVRGGGCHTSGTSSTKGGIVIDLSRYLNSVRIDEPNKLAYVGGGAVWATVDAEAIKYGLATVSGCANYIGVGGQTLGGGYGWLVGQHGMTIDNLAQVTVVTADGHPRIANETSNSDLFWGIRGAGPNFGCVTEFVLRLHPQRRQVFAGPLIFPPNRLAEVIAIAEERYATASETEGVCVIVTNKGRTGRPVALVMLFFNGEEEEAKRRFRKFFDLGPLMNGTRMIPYEGLNALHNESVSPGQNCRTTSYERPPLSPEVATKLFSKIIETASVRDDLRIIFNIEYHNLRRFASVAPDATAFTMRVPRPSIKMIINWAGNSEELTADAVDRLEQVRSFTEQALAPAYAQIGGKTELDTGNANSESGDTQSADYARALFGLNYPRLQQLKREYDPNMVFRSWYPILPAA